MGQLGTGDIELKRDRVGLVHTLSQNASKSLGQGSLPRYEDSSPSWFKP